MNRDLEEQLAEMGSEYRAVVVRLKDSREAEGFIPKVFRLRPYLTAASLLVLIGLGVCFLVRRDFRREAEDTRFAPSEYRASVDEMIVTQNPDGSWKNDFLTRRNAAALQTCSDPAARIAYKKAMRNLRAKGIL